MKKKILVAAVAALIALPIIFPSSVSAFWPFTKGEVKSMTTESRGGLLGIFRGTTPTPTAATELSEDAQEDQVTSTTLAAALKNKKLTEAQVTEIKKRLAEIKAEREKLKSLRKSFNEWLKENGIERRLLMGRGLEASPSGVRSNDRVRR